MEINVLFREKMELKFGDRGKEMNLGENKVFTWTPKRKQKILASEMKQNKAKPPNTGSSLPQSLL